MCKYICVCIHYSILIYKDMFVNSCKYVYRYRLIFGKCDPLPVGNTAAISCTLTHACGILVY